MSAPVSTVTLDKTHAKVNWTHYLAIYLWIGWTSFFVILFFTFPLWIRFAKYTFEFILFIIFLSAVCPSDRKYQPKWGKKFGDWLAKKAVEYFHMKVIVEDMKSLEKCGPAIFALEPHNILPLSIIGLNDIVSGIPGHKVLGCVTSSFLWVPLIKHIYTWTFATSVAKENLHRIIGEGISPAICPGGVRELFYLPSHPQSKLSIASVLHQDPISNKATEHVVYPYQEIVLYLRQHTGFLQLAYEHQIPVVPVFAFGLHTSFPHYYIPTSPWIVRWSQALGFLPMFFVGMGYIPFAPPDSRYCQYSLVVGTPIYPPSYDHINKNAIDKEHTTEAKNGKGKSIAIEQFQQQYIDAMQSIFERHAKEFHMDNFTLRIV